MSEQRNIIIDNIDFSEALRYLGYGNSTPDEKTKEILYNCADQLKSVMEGKYTYKVFDLVDGQVPGINFTLEGKSIANHLKNCEKVIFMCATLSAGVDGLIRKMQIRGMADAMFTDSLASAVIEQVCNKAEDEILEDFKEYEHTWRFGLGYAILLWVPCSMPLVQETMTASGCTGRLRKVRKNQKAGEIHG